MIPIQFIDLYHLLMYPKNVKTVIMFREFPVKHMYYNKRLKRKVIHSITHWLEKKNKSQLLGFKSLCF